MKYIAYIVLVLTIIAALIHVFYPNAIPYISSYCVTVTVDGPNGKKIGEGLFEYQDASYPWYIRPFKRTFWQQGNPITVNLSNGSYLLFPEIGHYEYFTKGTAPALSFITEEKINTDKELRFVVKLEYLLTENDKMPLKASASSNKELLALLGADYQNLRIKYSLNAGRSVNSPAIVYTEPCSQQPSIELF